MQGCIKLIKSDSKEMYSITKDLYFKSVLFFQTFYLSKNPEKMHHGFHLTILNKYFLSIKSANDFWHCDTED